MKQVGRVDSKRDKCARGSQAATKRGVYCSKVSRTERVVHTAQYSLPLSKPVPDARHHCRPPGGLHEPVQDLQREASRQHVLTYCIKASWWRFQTRKVYLKREEKEPWVWTFPHAADISQKARCSCGSCDRLAAVRSLHCIRCWIHLWNLTPWNGHGMV